MLRNKDFILEMPAVDSLTSYTFKSRSIAGARLFAKYFIITAIVFAALDMYMWTRHGQIAGGVFFALFVIIFFFIPCITYSATTTVSNTMYRTDYRVVGLSFAFEMPIKGWQILHVDYDGFHLTHQMTNNKMCIQFFLVARENGRPLDDFSMVSDLYFDLNHDPVEVASVIKKLKDATGFKLTFGKGPMRDIYPTYKKLYGELND